MRGVRRARGGGGGGRKSGIEKKLIKRRENERKRESVVCGAQISSNDLKNGVSLELDGTPFKVVEFMHVKPGKGAAFVRSKLKNAITGNVIDKVRDTNPIPKITTLMVMTTYYYFRLCCMTADIFLSCEMFWMRTGKENTRASG